MEELTSDSDISERAARGLINKEVIFRVKGSSEMLAFESGGFWHESGINHSLLV